MRTENEKLLQAEVYRLSRLVREREQQAAQFNDLLRNIAAIDDSNLYISKHRILTEAVIEWREEARKLLEGKHQ